MVLAPLAGIGNWFVRLQAKRHGAGLAVSEMVSSFAIHYGNEKTLVELLRIHPDERGFAAPTSIQLFGQDPEVMRSAAATVAERGADLIDLNMGCPVPKVCKTGAGAALIKDPDTAVAVARAAREGSGLPVTVKLRSGQEPGDTDGYGLAHRLVDEAGVSAIGFHPRSAAVHHKGVPDYDLAAKLVAVARRARDPHRRPAHARPRSARPTSTRAPRRSCSPAARWATRGCSSRSSACASDAPGRDEILDELDWVMDRAVEHLGPDRAGRYLRKFYPWYADRLGASQGGSGGAAAERVGRGGARGAGRARARR